MKQFVFLSHFKLSAALSGVFFISSLFTTGYVSWSNEHIPNSEDPFTQFDKIYDKPWTRLGPYLVGMFTGWILFKTNLKIRMSRVSPCLCLPISSCQIEQWTHLGAYLVIIFRYRLDTVQN